MSDEAASTTEASEPRLAFTNTKVVTTLKYSSPLIACRYHPQASMVVTAAQDFKIQLWRSESEQPVVLEGHDSWLRGLGFSPDGQTLYSAGYDGRLCFWQIESTPSPPQRQIEAHAGWIRWLAVSPDGQLIATAGNDHHVRLWSAASGELVHDWLGHEAHIYSLLFHPDGTSLLSGDLLGKIVQWNVADGAQERTMQVDSLHTYNGGQQAHYGGVRSMSLDLKQNLLACGGLHNASNPFGAVQEPLIVELNWETGETVASRVSNEIKRGIIWRAIYHPAGTLIGASGGNDGGYLLFWDRGNEKPDHQVKLPNTALDMDLHPEGTQLATAHHDGQLRLSDIA